MAVAAASVAGVVAAPCATKASTAAGPDPARGRSVFAAQCSVCHSNARNGGVVVGPPLFGVVGRKAGSVADFSYSSAMKTAGFAWTPDKLHAYLPAPRTYLPGVKMTYPGLRDPNQLDDLVAYLETLK
ncbi:cytochrome c family protein [Phenylobacterium hankyongense]|uniref:Cytochrome c family protein n=2 Tax=Phenylobacterium hankyongense TaxID=1813876 RepID=A0A328B2X6_9CAUL|nr:cytochrome c family protein [Phenylobacterium hankyongense]